MARSAAEETTSSEYVRWEEVQVSSDQRKKGREEVRYYLKRRDGKSDLAVTGKEKKKKKKKSSSDHHVSSSYHYVIQDKFTRCSISPYASSHVLKLRSRGEVVDWLNSFVSDSPPHQSSLDSAVLSNSKSACLVDVETVKDVELRKLDHQAAELSWLGPSWTCKKRRMHYQSFIRTGLQISVHAFVYVLAENKRLVAYLEDMYEDSRGNKMVVVRWFHKIDEVGIILPRNFNDREIFFSLCLQDLGVECLDGLTNVLSPQHYDKYLKEAKDTQLEPYVCWRQFDNNDIKPFDVTQIKGYWKQEILRSMSTTSQSEGLVKSQQGLKVVRNGSESIESRPKKRVRLSKDGDLAFHSANKQEPMSSPCLDIHNFDDSLACNPKNGQTAAFMSGQQHNLKKTPQHLARGSQVEVLSQDSGLRGCWLRALIIKKHKDKVKVQYQDIKDSDNEAYNLEEWVLASKVAAPDPLGLRIGGRTTFRPNLLSNKCKTCVTSGAVVDVWWHDGWWEGIVLQKETQDKLRVYLPGEKRDLVFGISDLRISEEWLGNRWQSIKERPDVVTSILSGLDTENIMVKACNVETEKATIRDEMGSSISQMDSVVHKLKEFDVVDLSNDATLAQLRWKSLGKRRRVTSFHKGSSEAVTTGTFDGFFVPKALKVDRDNCKYVREYPFSSSAVPPITSLVMSM